MAFTAGLGGSGSGGFNVFTGTYMKSKPGRRVGASKRSFKQREIAKFKKDWMWLIPGLKAVKAAKKGYSIYKNIPGMGKSRKIGKRADKMLDRANTRVFKSRYTKLSSKQKTAIKWAQINATGSLATWLANKGLRPLGVELSDFGAGPPVPQRYSGWYQKKRRF